MQWLHGLYAQTFNERHGRSGHLFQGRYGSVRVATDAQLWVLVRYLAVNPVIAAGGNPAERYSAMVADDYLCGGSESAARVRHTGE